MLKLVYTKAFNKDVKIAIKRGKNLEKLKRLMELLSTKSPLSIKYKDHNLIGNFIGRRECHIEPDWLLIYKIDRILLLLSVQGLIQIYFKVAKR